METTLGNFVELENIVLNPILTKKPDNSHIPNQNLYSQISVFGYLDERVIKNIDLLRDFINSKGKDNPLYDEIFEFVQRHLNGNYHDAQEVMIDTQTNVWKNLCQYDPIKNVRPWLYTVAINLCRDYRRKNRRWIKRMDLGINHEGDFLEREPEASGVSPLRKMEFNEEAQRLIGCVNQLPKKYREPLYLFLYGKKYREIAEDLGIKVGTVKSRMNSGKSKLQELMGNYKA